MAGTIVGIFIAPIKEGPTAAQDQVLAVAGRGLKGDRHHDLNQGDHDPANEITLIDTAALRRAGDEHGVALDPGEHRRNVVVEGLDLLALVGQVVTVGEAEVEVMADNPPCGRLQRLTGKPVLRALKGGGGVRGRIARGGTVRVGDTVQASPASR
jgi:MOSC domain-containing protein YiiM